jgi:putative exosortase-associated protein (TIGR04073 family)
MQYALTKGDRMKKLLLVSVFLSAFVVLGPGHATADQQPEVIVEKMAVKLVRGVTNAVTSIVELPKQTILTGREMGAVGYIVGPIKGVGMTLYRAVIGVTEAVFCMVPQPGYYDPLIDPEYVWQGWEPKRDTTKAIEEK